MPTETPVETEKLQETAYTYKSFELVFSTFCDRYEQLLEPFGSREPKDGSDNRFMGLMPNASVQQMAVRLNEVGEAMGQPPTWSEDQLDGVSSRDAVLLSGRYLAWYATMGGITQQYIDRLEGHIESEKRRGALNGNGMQSIKKFNYYRDRAHTILLAQNHALRDYFDSGLAATLGNDSPEKMELLLEDVKYSSERNTDARVRGVSLEIASKRYLDSLMKRKREQAVFGSDEQDARGGDLVILKDNEILFIDLKSTMPQRFSDGSLPTEQDSERGYKWLDHANQENSAAVWAYQKEPVSPGSFTLQDERLAHNLKLVAFSSEH